MTCFSGQTVCLLVLILGDPGRLLLEITNKTPNKDAFQFAKITDGLRRTGQYKLLFLLLPALPQQPPQTVHLGFTVIPGPAASMCLQVCMAAMELSKSAMHLC